MSQPYQPRVLPLWLDRALPAAGAGLAGLVLAAAWLTAGPGNWAPLADHAVASGAHRVLLPRVEIVARRGSGDQLPDASADARDAAVLRCAANTVGSSAIPAQN